MRTKSRQERGENVRESGQVMQPQGTPHLSTEVSFPVFFLARPPRPPRQALHDPVRIDSKSVRSLKL